MSDLWDQKPHSRCPGSGPRLGYGGVELEGVELKWLPSIAEKGDMVVAMGVVDPS